MDLSKLTKAELLLKCDEIGLTKVKSKTKTELITLINDSSKKSKIPLIIEPDSDNDLDDNDLDDDDDELDQNIIIENDISIDVQTELPIDLSGYKFIDLFCGIGGFHQALHKMGAKCVLACDIDKECRVVYKDNYGIEPVSNVKDIDEKTMDDFDILCAGFPCFIAGTRTLTENGYKNIEDVLITDKLLTHKGNFQPILNLQQKIYTGKLFEFDIKYHPELITATEEHPFYVREQKNDYTYGEPEWKIASKITMDDYFGMVINDKEIIPEFTFEQDHITLDKQDQWFTMGYYLGNQCNKQKTDIYNYTDMNWFKILKKFNDYSIPEWIQNAPKHLIQYFIDGYISSTGNSKNDDKNIISVISRNLAYGLQRLYLKLGHIVDIIKIQDIYQLYVYSEKPQTPPSSFIDGNYVWYAPFKITNREVTQTPVYNFEVETDNSYVVENVCVHNCQSFSNGGKKKCFDDERGLLFDEIVRIAKEKKPRFMFLENVKHILKVSNGEVIEYIKNKIAAIGYKLQLFQISPHNFGIPQQRERVYFVCVRNDIYNGTDIVLPTYLGKIDFNKFLDKKEEINEKYFIKGDTLDVLESWDIMVKTFDVDEKISPTIMINDAFNSYSQLEFDGFPVWKKDYITKNKPLIQKYMTQFTEWYKTYSDLLKKREIYGKLEWQTGPIKANDSIFNHFIQIRQSGIRVKKGHYFPTLVAIAQIPIYGKEKRYITPRECARLQSFPETFKMSPDDKKSYKQFGNSVNVNNVYTVISSTLKKYM
jgi:DNA (cytosine-5)-methyltransferase 1